MAIKSSGILSIYLFLVLLYFSHFPTINSIVLLLGGNGYVGSTINDALNSKGITTVTVGRR
jgi:hypothetical protein